jgi:hypothetical protein
MAISKETSYKSGKILQKSWRFHNFLGNVMIFGKFPKSSLAGDQGFSPSTFRNSYPG